VSRSHRRGDERERGAAVVEFALVLPLLLGLILATVDFGRYWVTRTELTSAAQEGARAVATGSGDALTTVRNAVSSVSPTSVAVTGPGSCTAGQLVTVTATYSFQFTATTFGLGGRTITTRGVMRCAR
jgi:Flp pilus assembly protein TadG